MAGNVYVSEPMGLRHIRYFLTTIQTRDVLWGGLASSLRSPQCRATVVFSNLGRVFESLPLSRREDGGLKVGEAVLESVDATPPIRFGTLISFSALGRVDTNFSSG